MIGADILIYRMTRTSKRELLTTPRHTIFNMNVYHSTEFWENFQLDLNAHRSLPYNPRCYNHHSLTECNQEGLQWFSSALHFSNCGAKYNAEHYNTKHIS